jgi:4-hydroxybenzoate polyprenyltransferase
MPPLLRALRIRQWTKNLVIFAGLAFSGQATDPATLAAALTAFAAFCAAASAVYLINDVLDRERDRAHPEKRHRAVASGALPVALAIGVALLLAAGALITAATLGRALYALAGYLALQAVYSLKLKHVVLLDVFSIAAGFSLRVLAGVWAVDAWLSPWLVACTVQLALFLALCKRRAEAASLGPAGVVAGGGSAQRPVLEDYRGPATDMMIGVMASTLLVTYTMYTLLPAAVLAPGAAGAVHATYSRAGAPGMIWTLPFALYGVLRYLYLVYRQDKGQRPELIATMDPGIVATGLGYVAVVAWVIYG